MEELKLVMAVMLFGEINQGSHLPGSAVVALRDWTLFGKILFNLIDRIFEKAVLEKCHKNKKAEMQFWLHGSVYIYLYIYILYISVLAVFAVVNVNWIYITTVVQSRQFGMKL